MQQQAYETTSTINGAGMRFAIVGSEWYGEAVDSMIAAAKQLLESAQVAPQDLDIFHVPGSLEIPVLCSHLIAKRKYDGIIAFGIIVQGDTYHHQMMIDTIVSSFTRITLDTGVPILNEILAVKDQSAVASRTTGAGNKGFEAAQAALKIAAVLRGL